MSILSQLPFTAPEEILSVGGLVLLMVAAYMGDKTTRFVGYASVALLAVAGFSLTGVAGHGGDAFDGLYRADAFGAFAKVLIYVAAAVCILIAPRFFEHEDKLRAEYPILILYAEIGRASCRERV